MNKAGDGYEKLLDILARTPAFPERLNTREHYRRAEDMGDGKVTVMVCDDGDVCLGVQSDSGPMTRGRVAGIEFCFPGGGGGASPLVRKALLLLACAIARENESSPWVNRGAGEET